MVKVEEFFIYGVSEKRVERKTLEDFFEEYGLQFKPFTDRYDWHGGLFCNEDAIFVWIETKDRRIQVKPEKIRRYADNTGDWYQDGERVEECLKANGIKKQDIVRIIVNKVVRDDNNGVYEETITIYE